MFIHNIVYVKCPYCRFCLEIDINCQLCPMCGGSLNPLENIDLDR